MSTRSPVPSNLQSSGQPLGQHPHAGFSTLAATFEGSAAGAHAPR